MLASNAQSKHQRIRSCGFLPALSVAEDMRPVTQPQVQAMDLQVVNAPKYATAHEGSKHVVVVEC